MEIEIKRRSASHENIYPKLQKKVNMKVVQNKTLSIKRDKDGRQGGKSRMKRAIDEEIIFQKVQCHRSKVGVL